MTPGLYVGVMSGTSADAVDAALIDLSASAPHLLASHAIPLSKTLQQAIWSAMAEPTIAWADFGRLDRELGMVMAEAVNALLGTHGIDRAAVVAIGSHGQTLQHAPNAPLPFTVQVGDPNTIAELTGITTIADFRRRDVAAGGQGAPLVPAFHQWWFGRDQKNRAILNLGGIANITCLSPDGPVPCCGFDTGPANGLMDAWHQRHQQLPYDDNGQWAAAGSCITELLACLLKDPYFHRSPPKSTGKEYFNLHWLDAHLANYGEKLRPVDVQATLAELTAVSVSQALLQTLADAEEVLVCGGGAQNGDLLRRLRAHLQPRAVVSTEHRGLAPQWVEAAAFAWLAAMTLAAEPGNVPAVTGAKGPRILGAIYRP